MIYFVDILLTILKRRITTAIFFSCQRSRSLYPEAFKTIYQGEPWLQVGAFGDWDKARKAEQNPIDLGLETFLID